MKHRPSPRARRHAQRGLGALGVALVLLFAMTMVAFFANRSLLFEQRSSANQYRSVQAFEAAEAGLEWATARLNDPRTIDAACRPVTGAAGAARSFRVRYTPLTTGLAFAPASAARPGCSLDATALSCSCPSDDSAPSLRDDAPGFTVEFSAVRGDPESLHIVSRGCSGLGTQCVPGTALGPADATATVQAVLKLRPAIRSIPVAAVTAGDAVTINGALRLTNADIRTQGYVVHAGGAVDVDTARSVTTLPGSPPANAVIARDESLARLAAQDADGAALFIAWFGATPAQFATTPTTYRIASCSGAGCGVAMQAAHADGHDSFVVDGDLRLDAAGWPGGSIGTPERPVMVVVRGRLALEGGVPMHGLVYIDTSDSVATVDAQLHGALVARGRLTAGGTGTIRHDPDVLARLRTRIGILARLPGSWQDARCSSDDPAQACNPGH
ncbi:pilus assembly PilX N-terminal domain-containing protein [uncultured Methylibium sp.]|uniref:pilus assembly PilX family protein n=1 Tax=uncultured Methylibium sp. TaxID=381093 RepID=UPI0025E58048|nr:pilus assembly PilX N-terminal domain-containing protein [uncultured Methylibium sp.]